jgi:hypothetical protein
MYMAYKEQQAVRKSIGRMQIVDTAGLVDEYIHLPRPDRKVLATPEKS